MDRSYGKIHECEDCKHIQSEEEWLNKCAIPIPIHQAKRFVNNVPNFFDKGDMILLSSMSIPRQDGKEVFMINVMKNKSLAETFLNSNPLWKNHKFYLANYNRVKERFPSVEGLFPPERFTTQK